jgi:hypothetical protein
MPTIQATETKTRFDIYFHVHKGLRAFMVDALTTVGRIDAIDADEVAAGISQVRGLLEICREHLFTENQFVHTAMEARRRGSACTTANEHVQHEEALERLETLLRTIERTSGTDLQSKLQSLYQELALFVADNFQHMNVEERENNEVLWSLYTDEELYRIHSEILASLKPETVTLNLRWILPYVSHPDRAIILAGLQKALPTSAFERILNLIRPHLNEKDWRKLNVSSSHFN